MTSERPDTAAQAGDQAPTEAQDEDIARALRDLTERVERIESGVNRLLSGYGPSASTLSAFTARTSPGFGMDPGDERHSRIADRFAERAALQEQTTPPYLGIEDDESGTTQQWSEPPAETPRRRRRRSGPAILVWLLLIAVVAGAGYYIGVYEPELRDEVLAQYDSLIDGAPDEVITVEGQPPLPQEEEVAAQRPDSGDAGTAGTAGGSDASSAASPPAAQATAPARESVGDGEPSAEGRVEVVDVEPPAVPATEPPQEAEPAPDAAASAASATTDESASDAAADDPAEETPASAAPEVADGPTPDSAGPVVAAVPSTPVVSEELTTLSEDLAPLPPDVDDEARRVAELALQDNPEAQHDLATIYALGQQAPQNYERAAFWYRLSSDGGIVNARYNLGVLTERGLGVTQDSDAAFALFLQAAEDGHPDAQNAVGLAYMHGHGVERDLLEAATWFQAASASGNPRGAFHLGRLFEQGLDGPPDLQAAAGWYRLAAEAGDVQAQEALERVTQATTAASPPTPEQEAVVESAPIPETTPAPVAPTRRASAGLNREAVREIQRLLNGAGFDAGPTDGLIGDRTRTAIESFQQAQGLAVDGQPSWELLQALRDSAGG